MAILSKPPLISKGIPADFEINKANLSGLPIVAQDPYFNDITNWNKIYIVYRNEFGNTETVIFDAKEISPVGKFSISDKTRGIFEVEAIMIYDFDGDYLLIPKVIVSTFPEFEVAFDVTLSQYISAWRSLDIIYSMAASYAA